MISHSKLLNYPGASTIFNGPPFRLSTQRSASPMAPAKCSSESPLRAAGRWAPRAVHLRSRCFQKVAEKGGTVADCTSLNIVYGNYTSSISRVASLSVKRYLILVSHTKMCKNRLTISTWSLLWMSNFEGTARKKAFMWQTIGGFFSERWKS